LHNEALANLESLNAQAQGNKTRAAQLVLQNLTAENLVTPSESQQLGTIIQLLKNNQTSTSDLVSQLSSIHNQLVEQNASSLAIAISGIAQSSAEYWANKTVGDLGQSRAQKSIGGVVWADLTGCLDGIGAAGFFGILTGPEGEALACGIGSYISSSSEGGPIAQPPSGGRLGTSVPAEPGSAGSIIGSNATTTASEEDQSSAATVGQRTGRIIRPPMECYYPPCPGEEDQSPSHQNQGLVE
jgi:hypothetical protein